MEFSGAQLVILNISNLTLIFIKRNQYAGEITFIAVTSLLAKLVLPRHEFIGKFNNNTITFIIMYNFHGVLLFLLQHCSKVVTNMSHQSFNGNEPNSASGLVPYFYLILTTETTKAKTLTFCLIKLTYQLIHRVCT